MVSSVTSSSSVMGAMQALRGVKKSVATLQTQIATGKRVNGPQDDAVTWSLAKGLTSEIAGQVAVQNGLVSAQAVAKTATSSVAKISDLMVDMNEAIAEAEANNVSKATLKSTLQSYVTQIESVVSGASYRGQNLINGSITTSMQVLSNLSTDSTGTTSASYLAITSQNLKTSSGGDLAALKTFVDSINTSSTSFADMRTAVNTAQTTVNTAAMTLGAAENQIDTQQELLASRKGILESHLSSLVDIDEAEASAQLSKLQTQQTLAESILAMSVQQQNTSILRLFGLA